MTQWLTNYGSLAVFGLLATGIIGLPIPDETLLVFAGLLMAKGHISLVLTPIAAFFGSIIGITTSYLLGYLAGRPLILRYGKYVGITEAKLTMTHNWFEHFGKWCLTIGYFIPGIRHLTGIVAGTAYLKYWEFAVFAYTGALLWSLTFISLGYYFYDFWQHFHTYITG